MVVVRPQAAIADNQAATVPRRSVSGRQRLILAACASVVVAASLFALGPAAIAPAPRRAPLLPGLTLEDSRQPAGIVVTSVQGNSIADDAGVEVGDIIVGLDDQRVASMADAGRYLGRTRPVVVDLKLVRATQPVEIVYAFPQRARS